MPSKLTEDDLQDIIGKKFSHITIIKRRPDKDRINKYGTKIYMYEYECDCPDHTHSIIPRNDVLSNREKMCRVCSKNRKSVDKNRGKVFGRLTMLDMAPSKISKVTGWNIGMCFCSCSCNGNIQAYSTSAVLSGKTLSCGCLNHDVVVKMHTTHGLSNSKLYMIFHGMIARCYNPNNKHYKYYGGRVDGPPITICDYWYTPEDTGIGFGRFAKWSYENGYVESNKDIPRGKVLSIERKDVNGPYSPDNCEWILLEKQARNTRKNIKIYDGEEILIESEFDRKYNCKPGFARGKRWRNWHPDAIVYAAKHPELELRRTCMEHTQNYYVDKDGFQRLIPTVNNKFYNDLEEKYRKDNESEG